jgi:senataxin
MGLDSYDWADIVYKAQIESPVEVDETAIRKTMQKHRLNRPQARAILSALETNGFSLIQG